MRYSNKITALLLVLTMSSMSLAQGKQLASEDKPDREDSHLLTVAVGVVGITLVAIGGRKIFKYIDSKWREAAEKAARETEKAKKRAEETRRAEELRVAEEARAEARKNARKEVRRKQRQTERQKERKAARQVERKKARQAERQAKREHRAEEIRRAEAQTAALVREHTPIIEHGKALQLEARNGKKDECCRVT